MMDGSISIQKLKDFYICICGKKGNLQINTSMAA